MLQPVTLEKLRAFRLGGFVDALIAQTRSEHYADLSFEERLTLLIEAEHAKRLDSRTKSLVKAARLPRPATLNDVDFSIPRGLKKPLFLELCQGHWLSSGKNLIITGPTGMGKTFLASAIAHSICVGGKSARFQRTHQWTADLLDVEERHRLPQTIAAHRRVPLMIFDEWMRDPIAPSEARVLLDLFDDRYERASCLFIAQIPVPEWHRRFEDPTLADAVLDRIVHHSIRLELDGESVRKTKHQGAIQGDTSLRSGNLD